MTIFSDETSRSWSFHINEYMQLCDQLEKHKDFLTVEGIPEFSMKVVRAQDEKVPSTMLNRLEPDLVESLFSFQKEAIIFGIAKGGRLIIGDDMGLGKTREALGIADFYRDDWPLLIVTTAAMRNRWQQEIMQLFRSVNISRIKIIETSKDGIADAKIVICSYAALDGSKQKLLDKRFGVVIFDESHSIKNKDSKQTQNATKLGHQAARVILVTGTPAMSRPCELFSQLAIIDKKFCSFTAYAKRFCNAHQTKYGLDATGSSNLQELNVILRKKFMIRRLKDDVQSVLPEKNRLVIQLKEVNFTSEVSEEMTELSNQYLNAQLQDRKHEVLLNWFVKTAILKQESVW